MSAWVSDTKIEHDESRVLKEANGSLPQEQQPRPTEVHNGENTIEIQSILMTQGRLGKHMRRCKGATMAARIFFENLFQLTFNTIYCNKI